MMKTFCDICGKEMDERGINLDVNCFGVSGFDRDEWNICNDCGQKRIIVTLQRRGVPGSICCEGGAPSPAPRSADGCGVGWRIREAREAAGLSRGAMADKLNLLAPTLGECENGTRQPSLELVARMCRVLGCTADSLLGVELGD